MPLFVVTGASQGIGRAIAEAFAREPAAHLVLLARNEQNLQETAVRCRNAGAEARIYPCDVTDEAAVARVAGEVVGRWGAPDVLVNNAGAFTPGTVHDTPVSDFREQLEINLTSAYIVTRAFLDAMVTRKSGSIFYLASVASIRAYPSGVAYGTAKHGLLGLARAVREETKAHGIRVTALLPGATYTPSWEGVDLPEDRFMPAGDVATLVRDIYHLSGRSVVEEILFRPQLGDI